VLVTADPALIRSAERVVVPGQGALPDCMRSLAASGAREAVLEALRDKPYLGLCLGLQMLFEHGAEGDTAGLGVLRQTVEAATAHGALVIVDAKRGDIGSTAVAYGETFLGPRSPFRGDAMTLSAYLGLGSLAPIFEIARREGAGVFVVIRSSNPEGSELQRARLPDGRSVAECLADEITESNAAASSDELGCIGAVLGATQGAEADELAERLPHSLLLVPGIGAQGATIADVRRDFARHYGRVVPSISRGIAGAGPAAADLKRAVEHYIAEIRSTA